MTEEQKHELMIEITARFILWRKENDRKLAEVLKDHPSGEFYSEY